MRMGIVMMVAMASSLLAGDRIAEYKQKKTDLLLEIVAREDAKLAAAKKKREDAVKKAILKHIGSLKKVKVAYTKAGNLEKALEAKADIEKYEKLIAQGNAKAKTGNKPKDIAALGYKLKRHPFGTKKGPNGHYYKLVKGVSTWNEAYVKAKAMGGYLATITSKEENDFVSSLLKSGHHVILGGVYKDNKWTWVTGETWSYVNWQSSPSKKGGVSIYGDVKGLRGKWKAHDLNQRHENLNAFVVEWEK